MSKFGKARFSVLIIFIIALIFIAIAVISRSSAGAGQSDGDGSGIKSGRYYLNGDKSASYIEIYDSGTLQCFYKNYADFLASLKNDLENADTSLLEPPEEVKEMLRYELKTGEDGKTYIVFTPEENGGSSEKSGRSYEYSAPDDIITDKGRFTYIG